MCAPYLAFFLSRFNFSRLRTEGCFAPGRPLLFLSLFRFGGALVLEARRQELHLAEELYFNPLRYIRAARAAARISLPKH